MMIHIEPHGTLRWAGKIFMVIAVVMHGWTALASSEKTVADTRIRAQLISSQQTILSSEIAGNISKITLREGDSFKKDQQLVEFDCSLLNAQLEKVKALVEIARQGLAVSKRLEKLNSISSFEVNQALAKVKETEAELKMMEVQISKCSLAAPFSGRIAKRYVNAYQYVTPGEPLIDIVDTQRLEVRLIAPSNWLAWIKKGNRFSIEIEELQKEYLGRVVQLGPRIDPVSQSVTIIGEIKGEFHELLPGMSGWASFSRERK
jgi:membrane fusion protein, multidrug efflux system